MKKLNFQAKTRLAFAIVFSIMLMVAIYLIMQLVRVGEHSRIMFEHPFHVSNTIREMKAEIYLSENIFRNIRFADNNRQLDSLKAEIDQKDLFIQESFKIVSQQYLGKKASIDSLFSNYTAWNNTCNKLYQLRKDNKTDSIEILLNHNLLVRFNSLVYSLNIISEFAQNKAENTITEITEVENQSILFSIILLSTTAFLVLFFIWYITRSISSPLKTFVSEANAMLKKDENSPVYADEQLMLLTLSELKTAFLNNERQSREIDFKNEKLSEINDELENKVNQRTAELNKANNELTILYESSRHLSSIVESTEDAIVSASPDRIIESWNHSAEKLFGYNGKEAVGENILLIIPPESSNDENIILDKILNGETIRHYETVRMKKNGEKFPVSLTVSPIKDSEGNFKGVSSIIRDVTEQKQVEDALVKSEIKFRNLVKDLQVGLLIQGPKTEMYLCNSKALELLDLTEEQLLGKSSFDPYWNVIHEDGSTFPGDTHPVAQAITTRKPVENIIMGVFRPTIGDRIWLLVNANPQLKYNGEVEQVVCTFIDITKRKQAEANLKLSEERYRFSLETTGQIGWSTPPDGVVEDMPMWREYSGQSLEEVSGWKWLDAIHPDDRESAYKAWSNAAAQKSDYHTEYRIRRADGIYRNFMVRGIPLFNTDGLCKEWVGTCIDITDLKQLEEELQKWNTQFKKLSSNAPGMLFQFTRRTDGSFFVPIASEGIRELYGCSPEDVIDDFSPIIKVIHPDDIEKMMLEIENSAKNMTLFNFVYRVQLPGESIKWLLSKSTPDKMEDGSITWYGYNTDITDHKQAEDTLLKLTEQFEHIGEMAKIGGWELDIATTQVTYSKETARIHEVDFPYVPPKLSQGNEYYPPDIWPDVQATVQAAIENGTAYDREWPFITAKGKHIWVRVQGFAVRENGKTIKLRGTFQDITERKQAEAELLKSELRYSSLFNHMQEGFALHEIICDTNGKPVDYRFLDINPSFELLTGLKKSEIIGKTVLTVIPDTETFWIEKYGAVALNGNPMEFENYSVPLKRHYQIKAFCPAKNQFAVLFSDITDRKQAEEVLFYTVQNLELSNKDLEQFAYVANHDLQEPLRMISSYTQLLERKYKDKLDQDANDYIRFAVDGAIRIQKLLNDLLEYSKINNQTKIYEQIDSSTLMGQTISNLQPLMTEHAALITNDDLPLIKADETQMIRLFQNLIENAIKFHKKTELPKIHISCTKQDKMYLFSVADNGIGIEKQYYERIFVVFQRLHSVKEYPGTGIGLSICKRIVERHGGTIWLESVANEGTTFYFTIPV